MKKLIFSLFLICSIGFINAQPFNVTSCHNYLKYKEFDKAKEAIDKAIEHPKTSNKAKTWIYYAKTYHKISDKCMFAKGDKAEEIKEKYCNLDPEALNKAYKAYLKAWVLNFKNPANRTIKVNTEDGLNLFFQVVEPLDGTNYTNIQYLNDILSGFGTLKNALVNKGLTEFQELKNYKKAAETFQNASFSSQVYSLFDGSKPDLEISYYTALAYDQDKQYDKARIYYEGLIKSGYGKDEDEKSKMYMSIANTYLLEEDTAKYVETLDKGIEKYPNQTTILFAKINYLISAKQSTEAKDLIEKAIAQDSQNKLLHYNLGTIYDNQGEIEKATESYNKALEIDSMYFDAVYNLGALYVNQAAEMQGKCDDIPPNKQSEYQTCKKDVNAKFKEALPHLEKAYSINPKDKSTVNTLKQLYVRLGNTDKYMEMKKILEELE